MGLWRKVKEVKRWTWEVLAEGGRREGARRVLIPTVLNYT
jgi:hypothetical protein